MGCSNVHCSYSDITIQWGDKIIFYPLIRKYCKYNKKPTGDYKLLSLGIHCEYDDYQGVKNIVENKHAEDIVNLFNLNDIYEFVNHFLEYSDYTNKYINEKLNINPRDEVTYMFVLKEVYDVMSKPASDIEYKLNTVMWGKDDVLKYLGFEYKEERQGGRYTKVYSNGIKEVYSDGQWIEGNHFYYDDLIEQFGDSDKLKELYEKGECGLIHLFDTDKIMYDELHYLFEKQYDPSGYEKYWDFEKRIKEDKFLSSYLIEQGVDDYLELDPKKLDKINNLFNLYKDHEVNFMLNHYISNSKYYSKYTYPLKAMYLSGMSMSKRFEPFRHLKTPQSGEHKTHQRLLEAFCKINKNKIYHEDD